MAGSRIGLRAVGLLQGVLLAGAPGTNAQVPQLSCKPSDDVGVVHGAVSKEGDLQVDHGVVLAGPVDCIVRTDSSGYFRFEYVPAGSYELYPLDGGSRIFDPIAITVAGDTTERRLRLLPFDIVADCLALEECEPLMRPVGIELPPSVDPLEEAGLRTGIGAAVARRYAYSDWVPCLDGASPVVITTIRRIAPAAVSSSECDLGSGEMVLRHVPTGRYAFTVGFNAESNDGRRATGEMWFSHGFLASAGWKCEYELGEQGWTLISCRLAWRS